MRDRETSLELLDRLAIIRVEERVRRCRLRWFGHVKRKSADDWVSRCRQFEVVVREVEVEVERLGLSVLMSIWED